MTIFDETIYGRIQRVSKRKFGLNWSAYTKTVAHLLKQAWCAETARPQRVRTDNDPVGYGQDDVTAYFLAVHVLGGHIGQNLVVNHSGTHFFNLVPNGEGESTMDYCASYVTVQWRCGGFVTPQQFWEREQDRHRFAQRYTCFEERFLAALAQEEKSVNG